MKKAPTLHQLATSIESWQAETFPAASAASAVEHMRREVIELHEHFWRDTGLTDEDGRPSFERVYIKGPISNPEGPIAEEIADIFFMLVQFCRAAGFKLAAAVAFKFAKNLKRKWKEPDAHGVVEHEAEG